MSRSTGTAHPGAPVLHCYIHTVGENEIASSNRLASAMISTAALARAMIASLRASCVRRPSMDPLFGLKRGLIVLVVLVMMKNDFGCFDHIGPCSKQVS